MAQTTKIIKQIATAMAVVNTKLTLKEGKFEKTASKINYAFWKFQKQVDLQAKLNEFQQDIDIELCSTDEKGNVLFDEKGRYVFTKENLKARIKAIKELDQKEISFEPYYILPEELGVFSEEELEDLKGVFVP
jgi:hypothetical protein